MLKFAVSFLLLLRFADVVSSSPAHKTQCVVYQTVADCSHMNLNSVPQDLPELITALDVSHNRLSTLDPSSVTRYRRLARLDVSYNSLAAVPRGLCQVAPTLRQLSMRHNEVYLLQEADLMNCTGLTHLDLSDNKLRLKGEPFTGVSNLKWLDVSRNKLTTVQLGTRPQLQSLETLVFNGNNVKDLKKDDFSFLSDSSQFQTLGLASVQLKTVESGCFRPIAGFQNLVLDGCTLGSFLSRLSEELSYTALRNLSLQNTHQGTLTNSSFKGLVKTNVTILDLSSNNMVEIADGAFQWLQVLKVLILDHNNLKRLTNGSFVGLNGLKTLSLRAALTRSRTSPYPIIKDFAFQPLAELEDLWMDHNSFREFGDNIFSGLHSLRTLDLSWCTTGLKMVTNTTFASLKGSSHLQTLNLTAMAITKLGPGAFSHLENLTRLFLSHNFISQQLTGMEFLGLNSLEEMYLSSNQQKIALTSESFANVPTLRFLAMGRALNGSLDIEPSPFRMLLDLTHLDLSNNNIANIKSGFLDGLRHLSVLKLQHNNLARFWKSANPGGPVLFLRDARNLTVLELDYNGLDEIPVVAFQGLRKLQRLSLNGNLLNFLHRFIFNDLMSLRFLSLQKNLLTTVLPETFQIPLLNLTELRMDHNPFDCTCESILWFSSWLNATNTSVPGRQGYICNTPSAYFNRSVMLFDPQSCKNLMPFQALYVFSSTLVLGLMVVAFLVHFQGWRIQLYWNITINRILDLNDSSYRDLTLDRYEYAAYVVHAQEDQRWVRRSLLSLEDDETHFFLEDRDAMPGCSALETIVENMRRSRKIIFVVTEALLNDRWCRQFKAHHALHQLMEESRDSLILVFLQDVADHRLSQSLLLRRGMLKRRCLVEWPLQKERIPAFRQKLRQALSSSNRLS